MIKIIPLFILLISAPSFSQESIVLSAESATEKGISPIWPKCERSRQTPIDCFANKLSTHIVRNFEYPDVAKKDQLSGTVVVDFIINKKGKVEVVDAKGAHRYLLQAAVKIIRAIPKMIPAKWGVKPIAVAYTVPITFRKPS